MTWLVAVACINREFFSDPKEFCLNPESRIVPHWVCGVVESEGSPATSEQTAFDLGLSAYSQGEFKGYEETDLVVNYFTLLRWDRCADPTSPTHLAQPNTDAASRAGETLTQMGCGRVSSESKICPSRGIRERPGQPNPTKSGFGGVVQAGERGLAYDAAQEAWNSGLLSDQQATDEFMNLYVKPLIVR